jgi:hypothetical protein
MELLFMELRRASNLFKKYSKLPDQTTRNSDVLTKLSQIPSFVEYTSITT